jgi:hypothetical protein
MAGIMLALAFTFSCSSPDGGGGGTDPSTGGTFTVTDIPAKYNGKYVYCSGSILNGTTIVTSIGGYESRNTSTGNYTWSRISNGKVSIPVWLQHRDGNLVQPIVRYSGNDTFDMRFAISEVSTSLEYTSGNYGLAAGIINSVTFSNGSAIISRNDATAWTESK